MQRCSNCGAAVRPGAKFCTSCGTRLNPEQTPSESPWARPDTEETAIATPAVTVEEEPGTKAEGGSDQAEEEHAPEPETAGAATTNWRWTSPEQAEEERADSGTSTPDAGQPEQPASTTWSWGQRPEPEEEPEKPASLDEATTSGDLATTSWATRWPSLGGAPSEPAEDESSVSRFAAEQDEAVSDETPDATTPVSPGEEAETMSDAVPVVDSAAPAPEAPPAGNARERASALVDELRRLIPQIGGEETPSSEDTGTAATGIADDLARARDAAGEFSSLRRALETARDNPRDVDTMLDLVGRADRLLALLDSHETLTNAIDDAVAKLRRS